MASWRFLTSYAWCCCALRATRAGGSATSRPAIPGITERGAYGIVTGLAAAGYVVKQRDGRRNRYQIRAHLPLPEPTTRERTVGEVLTLLAGGARLQPTGTGPA